MNIIEAAEFLIQGKKIFSERPNFPVHLNPLGLVVFDDGEAPPVHIQDLLSNKWSVVDE